jgi:hypothetical protein
VDSAPQAAAIAAVTSSASGVVTVTPPDVEETREDDSAPLVAAETARKFKFAFNHLTCIGVGILHIAWMGFGTALTFPMFFRYFISAGT